MYIRLGFLVSFKNQVLQQTVETDVTIWLPSIMPGIKDIFKKVIVIFHKNVIYANTSSIYCYFNELNIHTYIYIYIHTHTHTHTHIYKNFPSLGF